MKSIVSVAVKSVLLAATFVSFNAMAVDGLSEADQSELSQLVAHIGQISIGQKHPIDINLINPVSISTPSEASACALTSSIQARLIKVDNAYFKEQFSALLTSHKLKQPVELTLKSESGVCFIENVAVRH